eukprot:CAMPEP_0172510672 /NCGR_PEP_ID=MMETSP1066-20121228/230534_1 /TAXON_ID=671091 /ORGANISM="Coscinodiscus wailesii, Strain CCMP2513" /LENGTH=213 /DNA_ID=CAMNT_0013289753 /DNA_START=144 /DNA_END=785 /DNA_ORIENTATION=+
MLLVLLLPCILLCSEAFTPPRGCHVVTRCQPSPASPIPFNYQCNKRANGRNPLFNFSTDDNDDEPASSSSSSEAPDLPLVQSTIRMDDGGSDLTNRFKYKVNALMGAFDPPPSTKDDEFQNGNILSAVVNFPARYSFTVVGRTGGEESVVEEFVRTVTKGVGEISGDEGMEWSVSARGKKFTRVVLDVNVDSAAVINSIYECLDEIDLIVMKY